jgi:hypothetical protein
VFLKEINIFRRYMTSPMVAAMLEVFFSRRAGRFNGNNVKKRPKNRPFLRADFILSRIKFVDQLQGKSFAFSRIP